MSENAEASRHTNRTVGEIFLLASLGIRLVADDVEFEAVVLGVDVVYTAW